MASHHPCGQMASRGSEVATRKSSSSHENHTSAHGIKSGSREGCPQLCFITRCPAPTVLAITSAEDMVSCQSWNNQVTPLIERIPLKPCRNACISFTCQPIFLHPQAAGLIQIQEGLKDPTTHLTARSPCRHAYDVAITGLVRQQYQQPDKDQQRHAPRHEQLPQFNLHSSHFSLAPLPADEPKPGTGVGVSYGISSSN